ncbi:MAG: hypothetical protein IJB52_10500 [Clostridia bacterium]|nr:hypothetical protein [Clostridia bacterium]
MIKHTCDVDFGQHTTSKRLKYAEEYKILTKLTKGHNVLFEYRTYSDAARARVAIYRFAMRNGIKVHVHTIERVKVLVEVV